MISTEPWPTGRAPSLRSSSLCGDCLPAVLDSTRAWCASPPWRGIAPGHRPAAGQSGSIPRGRGVPHRPGVESPRAPPRRGPKQPDGAPVNRRPGLCRLRGAVPLFDEDSLELGEGVYDRGLEGGPGGILAGEGQGLLDDCILTSRPGQIAYPAAEVPSLELPGV